jgi:rhamnosyl/mannosyltransferase
MKILVMISEAPPITSGVARVGEEIRSRLVAAGHTVDVLSSNDIPRIEFGEVRLSSMLWKGLHPLIRLVHSYDVVHIHGPAPTFSDVALLLTALRRGQGPPIVYTHHSEIELPGKQLICAPYNTLHHQLARLADHVVVSTPSYASLLERTVPRERISVIPWGLTTSVTHVTKPKGFHVLFVGQLRPYKGLDVLLRAFARLQGAKLTIIGDGHQRAAYEAMTRELDLHDVHFLGRAPESVIAQAYEEAHVLVLPSRTRAEAFGIVLLEGMANGCVPVTSCLPGIADVVGNVGCLFPTDDDQALAAVLQTLQHDRADLLHRAQQAQHRAALFTWDATAAGYERLFRELATNRVARRLNWFPQTSIASVLPSSTQFSSMEYQVLRAWFERLIQNFDASRASLMLRHPDEDDLIISLHKGLDIDLIGTHVALNQSFAGWVAASRRPILINGADGSDIPPEARRFLHRRDLSSLSIPLFQQDDVVGVLNMARHQRESAYTHDDLYAIVERLAALRAPLHNSLAIAT